MVGKARPKEGDYSGMIIRTYQGGDEAQIIALWNRTLVRDPITAQTFYRKVLLDPNFDPQGVFLVVDRDQILGYVQAVIRQVPLGTDFEPDLGWITALTVDPQVQRQHWGSQLLERALQYLKNKGRARVEFSPYAPFYVVPGVDRIGYPGALEFFQARGFSVQYSPVAMDKGLVDFTMPRDVQQHIESLEQAGILVEPISPPFYTRLFEFCDREFYADWSRSLREALAMPIDATQLMICREGDVVLGFALFGAYDGHLERFGPFGVAESERGRGLGKALLYRTLEAMKQRGCHSAWFLWTGERSPAGYLYYRAGFEVTRRFDILEKRL